MEVKKHCKLMEKYLKIMAVIAIISGVMDIVTWIIAKFTVPCYFLGIIWFAAAILFFCVAKLYERIDQLENGKEVIN